MDIGEGMYGVSNTACTLVNVCALNRSGSTMLDLMLGTAPSAFSCGEIYALYRPWRYSHFNPECGCGDPACQFWSTLVNLDSCGIHQQVARHAGVSHVIDSSKELSWLIDSTRCMVRQGGRVMNVVLWKRPTTLAYSYWKRGRSVSELRSEYLAYYGRLLKLGMPYCGVQYEELVSAPAEVLALLCNRIGLSYVPGQEEFWNGHHHHLFGSAGTKAQLHSQQATIRRKDVVPPEYEAWKQEVWHKLEDDPALAEILRLLSANDISVIPESPVVSENRQLLRQPYPYWYYARRMNYALKGRAIRSKAMKVAEKT